MAAKRKPKEETNEFLAALKFVSRAQSESGTPNQTHCRIGWFNYVVAYDGILAMGYPVKDNVPETCPHTLQLVAAIERAKDVSALTFETNSITVKTNKFRATVPCLSSVDLHYVTVDQGQYAISKEFVAAAQIAAIFTKEGAQTVAGASVLTRNGSLVGTNGLALIEAWHGIATPPGLIIPKTFFDVIAKIDLPMQSFGYSENTFTLWYENGAWVKTQLYSEQWPNVDQLFAYTETAKPEELDKDFWTALKSVSPFSEDHRVYFMNEFLCSHVSPGKGAEYKLKGLPSGQAYNAKILQTLEGIMKTADWTGNEKVSCFFGDNVRGVLSKMQI